MAVVALRMRVFAGIRVRVFVPRDVMDRMLDGVMRRMSSGRRVVGRMLGDVLVVACHARAGAPRPAQCASAANRYPRNRLRPLNANGNGDIDPAKTTKGRHMPRDLAIGDKAPDFRLPRDDGTEVSLRDFMGRNLVLYFYPKADTPGCTKEAIAFSRLRAAFTRAGTDILGVSADPVAKQDKFRAKHKLSIALASDESKKMLAAYGAWGEKTLYGRKFLGVMRKTFLIDGKGRIAQIWPKVTVEGHAEEVLAAAKAL